MVAGVYEKTIDRDSAYEKLTGRVNAKQPEGSVPADGGGWGRQPEVVETSPAPAAAAPAETSMFDTGIARVIKGAAGDLVRGTVSGAIGGQAGRAAGSMAGGVLGGLMQGSGRKDSIVEVVAKSAARSIGSSVGRQIVRGVLGGLLGGVFGKW